MARFSSLSAVLLNCSLAHEARKSHTRRLLARVGGVMSAEGVAVELIHMLDHEVGFGMVKDTTTIGDQRDDWPAIHGKIMAADILVIGTPIWLGVKSSIATLAIERLYAFSGDKNKQGQYLYYGKAGGCVVTGNEDGVKAVSMETLYALAHIGYSIPPQADCGWLGDIGPGPSYGDKVDGVNRKIKRHVFVPTGTGSPALGGTPRSFEGVLVNRKIKRHVLCQPGRARPHCVAHRTMLPPAL